MRRQGPYLQRAPIGPCPPPWNPRVPPRWRPRRGRPVGTKRRGQASFTTAPAEHTQTRGTASNNVSSQAIPPRRRCSQPGGAFRVFCKRAREMGQDTEVWQIQSTFQKSAGGLLGKRVVSSPITQRFFTRGGAAWWETLGASPRGPPDREPAGRASRGGRPWGSGSEGHCAVTRKGCVNMSADAAPFCCPWILAPASLQFTSFKTHLLGSVKHVFFPVSGPPRLRGS